MQQYRDLPWAWEKPLRSGSRAGVTGWTLSLTSGDAELSGGERAAQAVCTLAALSSPSSSIALSRIRNFWTFPVTVIGKPSTNFQ